RELFDLRIDDGPGWIAIRGASAWGASRRVHVIAGNDFVSKWLLYGLARLEHLIGAAVLKLAGVIGLKFRHPPNGEQDSCLRWIEVDFLMQPGSAREIAPIMPLISLKLL